MSSTSVTSSKREAQEKINADLMLELDAVRSLNVSLKTFLDHIRRFRKDLLAMDDNYKQLSKVNSEWIEIIKAMK